MVPTIRKQNHSRSKLYSDNLAHVQVVINCPYSVAHLCTSETKLAHNLSALHFDDVMSYNSLTTEWIQSLNVRYSSPHCKQQQLHLISFQLIAEELAAMEGIEVPETEKRKPRKDRQLSPIKLESRIKNPPTKRVQALQSKKEVVPVVEPPKIIRKPRIRQMEQNQSQVNREQEWDSSTFKLCHLSRHFSNEKLLIEKIVIVYLVDSQPNARNKIHYRDNIFV